MVCPPVTLGNASLFTTGNIGGKLGSLQGRAYVVSSTCIGDILACQAIVLSPYYGGSTSSSMNKDRATPVLYEKKSDHLQQASIRAALLSAAATTCVDTIMMCAVALCRVLGL